MYNPIQPSQPTIFTDTYYSDQNNISKERRVIYHGLAKTNYFVKPQLDQNLTNLSSTREKIATFIVCRYWLNEEQSDWYDEVLHENEHHQTVPKIYCISTEQEHKPAHNKLTAYLNRQSQGKTNWKKKDMALLFKTDLKTIVLNSSQPEYLAKYIFPDQFYSVNSNKLEYLRVSGIIDRLGYCVLLRHALALHIVTTAIKGELISGLSLSETDGCMMCEDFIRKYIWEEVGDDFEVGCLAELFGKHETALRRYSQVKKPTLLIKYHLALLQPYKNYPSQTLIQEILDLEPTLAQDDENMLIVSAANFASIQILDYQTHLNKALELDDPCAIVCTVAGSLDDHPDKLLIAAKKGQFCGSSLLRLHERSIGSGATKNI